MSLNETDLKAIKSFLPWWGVSEEEATTTYELAKNKAIKQHGDGDPKITANRAIQIATVVLKLRSYLRNEGKPRKLLIVGISEPRDMWANKRNVIFKQFEELKKVGKEKEAFQKGLVMLDKKTGQIIPLCPALKGDGTPSKVAGKPMPSPEESKIQNFTGITYVEEKGKKQPIGFIGTTSGDTCITQYLDRSKIYEVAVLGEQIDKTTGKMKLTFVSMPKEADDEYLQQGLDKLGLPKMIKSLFKELVVDQPTVASFATNGIPDAYKGNLIMENVLISSINPKPNRNGNIRFEFEPEIDIDKPPAADAKSVMGLLDATKFKSDFGPGTVAMIIGRAWVPQNNEDGRVVLNVDVIIPYPGKVMEPAPAETQDIPEEEVDEAASKTAAKSDDVWV